jgi:hypothetical protein
MLTGIFRPSGARSPGTEASADASDAQEAPHGFLRSKTSGAAARTPGRRYTRSLKPPWTRSGAR